MVENQWVSSSSTFEVHAQAHAHARARTRTHARKPTVGALRATGGSEDRGGPERGKHAPRTLAIPSPASRNQTLGSARGPTTCQKT